MLNFTTRLGYDGKCGQGGGPDFTVKASSIPLAHNGSFRGKGKGTLGSIPPIVVTIRGSIKGRNASGTVFEPASLRCNTPPNVGALAYSETFSARAK